jgi:hypothetical protein
MIRALTGPASVIMKTQTAAEMFRFILRILGPPKNASVFIILVVQAIAGCVAIQGEGLKETNFSCPPREQPKNA